MVFVAAGAAGVAWVVWWMISYRSNTDSLSANPLDAPLLAVPLSFAEIVAIPSVRTLVFAKFMSDSAWYFLLFWLPKYLYDARGFDIKHVSYYAWIPYAASGVGSFLGGWFSSRMLRRGRSLDVARKVALGLSAVFMPVVMLVPLVPVQLAILLFSVAFFFQQSWSGLIMTVPADIFPLSAVGTVSGLVGFGGAIGGAIFGVVAGYLLGHGFGYGTLFVLVGTFHLIGFLAILLFAGKIQPLRIHNHREIESHSMKITEVRTRVVQWEGDTVSLPPHFCTNPMDLVNFGEASMGNFAFHGWVLVEIFTDAGLVGLGNAALSPLVTKTLIDTYLTPLLIGADPWDTEYLWQQMYRRTMAFGRKGRGDDRDLGCRYRALGSAGQRCKAARVPPARADERKTRYRCTRAVFIPCRSKSCGWKLRSIKTTATPR